MNILGIDPGLGGAIALFVDGRLLEVHDMPTVTVKRGKTNKRELDLIVLVNSLALWRPLGHAWVERVSAMPGQGVTSMFSFGRSLGQVEGILAAMKIPVSYVTPQSWQKAVGMPKGPHGSRQRASQLIPDQADYWPLVKHHGRADAALIGWYGCRQMPSMAATSSGCTVPSHDSDSCTP